MKLLGFIGREESKSHVSKVRVRVRGRFI